jgi:hypothetical protein
VEEKLSGRSFQSKIIDANNAAFAAQEERTELIEKVRQLEKQVGDLTAWQVEKQRYELIEASEGAFTYVLKADRQSGEPIHWLCANCYQNNKKSILQLAERNVGQGGRMNRWNCPTCRASILVQWGIFPVRRDPDRLRYYTTELDRFVRQNQCPSSGSATATTIKFRSLSSLDCKWRDRPHPHGRLRCGFS